MFLLWHEGFALFTCIEKLKAAAAALKGHEHILITVSQSVIKPGNQITLRLCVGIFVSPPLMKLTCRFIQYTNKHEL